MTSLLPALISHCEIYHLKDTNMDFDLKKKSIDNHHIWPCKKCISAPSACELLTLFINCFETDTTQLINQIVIGIFHTIIHAPKEMAENLVWNMEYRIQRMLMDLCNRMMEKHGRGHQIQRIVLQSPERRYVHFPTIH